MNLDEHSVTWPIAACLSGKFNAIGKLDRRIGMNIVIDFWVAVGVETAT